MERRELLGLAPKTKYVDQELERDRRFFALLFLGVLLAGIVSSFFIFVVKSQQLEKQQKQEKIKQEQLIRKQKSEASSDKTFDKAVEDIYQEVDSSKE